MRALNHLGNSSRFIYKPLTHSSGAQGTDTDRESLGDWQAMGDFGDWRVLWMTAIVRRHLRKRSRRIHILDHETW